MVTQQVAKLSFGSMVAASVLLAVAIPLTGLVVGLPLLILWIVLLVKGLREFGRRALWMLLGAPIFLLYFYTTIALVVFYES